MDGIYFRIIRSTTGTIVIVEMQDIDELDYTQSRFLTKKRFATEKKAKKYIAKMQARWKV